MSYTIRISAAAERDIAHASDYISFVLKNPKAADDLLNGTELKVNVLSSFPEQFALADDPLLASWGIRFIPVKNYLMFYLISKENQQVAILRFLCKKSNWPSILKQEGLFS